MKKVLILLITLIATAATASAGSSTFYSQVTVKTASGGGNVYADVNSEDDDTKYATTYTTAVNSIEVSSSTASSGTQSYYLFAKPETGYRFDHWSDGSTDNPHTIEVTATSKESGSPTTAEYSATFEPTCISVYSSNTFLGTASIDKINNNIGDEVKLTATYIIQPANGEFGFHARPSKSVKFLGWFDEDGNMISDQLTTTYTVSKAEKLEARFEREFVIKTDEDGNIYGYYRLQSPYGANNNSIHFLCLKGTSEVKITTKDRLLDGSVEFNQTTADHTGLWKANYDYAKSEAVYSDAGSIFYVTGKANKSNLEATESRTTVATDLVAAAQGTSTSNLIGNNTITLKTAVTPGYYILFSNNLLSLQAYYYYHIWVTTDKPTNDNFVNNGDLDIQPVDLEHIDTNYFGAYPDQSMVDEDGYYWTSMYTVFPYECYEPDGVEAYVVNSVTSDGTPIAVIRRLESGIVPAETPVLLKCKTLSPSTNRLLPLLPDDERLTDAAAEVGDNFLTGSYGLITSFTAADKSTSTPAKYVRDKYEASNMRVFSVNANGTLGFYSLAAGEDGTAQDLAANRAYLDLSKVPAGAAAVRSFRIVGGNGDYNGVESVAVENADATPEYYNLQGVRVAQPVNGQFYIERRGNTAKKIIYCN